VPGQKSGSHLNPLVTRNRDFFSIASGAVAVLNGDGAIMGFQRRPQNFSQNLHLKEGLPFASLGVRKRTPGPMTTWKTARKLLSLVGVIDFGAMTQQNGNFYED
jgi:hypothetical protein